MGRLQPGQRLAGGRYTIVRSLSQGGMGAIDLAVDHEAFDRMVVIKTLLPPEQPDDEAERHAVQERFLREARTLAALRYPTIPQIFACFQEGGQTLIAMEYIDGTDLSAQLSRVDAAGERVVGRPAPVVSVVRWGIALCRTLEYLASRQPPVVHQDLKPANLILARESGELYLVDFGAARLRPAAIPGGGKTAIFGTPGYAAPEQFQGLSEPRSDVYALAATLYHLATDDDPADHLFDFPRLSHLGYLGQILRGALQPAVEARPDAGELRIQLEALQQADGSRPLRAPDGTVLYGERELQDWCEGHWAEAATWLYGTLPERVEADWVRPDLARNLRQWAAPFGACPERGLDAVLARLDPTGFGAHTPELRPASLTLDLGELPVEQLHGPPLTLTNSGRRYVEATVEQPEWLLVEPRALALAPGQSATLSFGAARRMSPTRPSSGYVRILVPGQDPLPIRVQGTAAPLTKQRSNAQRPNAQRAKQLLFAVLIAFWLMGVLLIWASSFGQAM